MTNQAYFISILGFSPSADLIEASLIDNGLVLADNYETANMIAAKRAAIHALTVLLSTADITQGTGETNFSAKYDRNAIIKRLELLTAEVDGIGSGPVIKGIQPW